MANNLHKQKKVENLRLVNEEENRDDVVLCAASQVVVVLMSRGIFV